MMLVLDASAVLAYLQGEPGSEMVRQALAHQSVCSAANWSEIAQKSLQAGRDWPAARQLLQGYGLHVEPVTPADAEWAAIHWVDHKHLALGDRLCLALAHRLGATALTADAAWGSSDSIQQIR